MCVQLYIDISGILAVQRHGSVTSFIVKDVRQTLMHGSAGLAVSVGSAPLLYGV
jgi:hypothetical protein